ncbi:putative protease Axl1p [[Candida] railenensis]|uniref:Protease Axl1p n=1 Tax=[Candida] railenensis TaxID=45579 RepID=A0A9P0QRZ1_9ASCO|nr:putative protease Axl1p [[Candida] railenensis]
MTYLRAKTIPSNFIIPLSSSHRNHRLISLPNGLICLLISDASKEVSAASVCVSAGSSEDPDALPGLAHLCEHMLFAGTDEFPSPSGFFESVTKAGGSCNAFTTGFRTTFEFQLPSDATNGENGHPLYHKMLENFASFFKSPIFDPKYIEMEIKNVDNEHQSNKSDTNKIMYYGLKLFASDGHSFKRFSTGNLENFNRTKLSSIRSKLKEYFETNFLADRMRLVLIGPQSANQLQKLAIQYFDGIKGEGKAETEASSSVSIRSRLSFSDVMSRSNRSDKSISVSLDNKLADTKDNDMSIHNNKIFKTGKVLFIKSDTSKSILRLVFPIENTSQKLKYYSKIWSSLLGDESKNSLFIQLDGCLTSIYAYTSNPTQNADIFILEYGLTKKGLRCLFEILTVTFNYISSFLSSKRELISAYLTQFLTIDKLNFYFKDLHPSPMEESGELAGSLQGLFGTGNDDIIAGNICYENLESFDIDEFIVKSKEIMTFSNFNVILMSQREAVLKDIVAKSDLKYINELKSDPFYGFNYNLSDIDVLRFYSNCNELNSYFPIENQFLAYTLSDISTMSKELTQMSSDPDPSCNKYTVKDSSNFSEPKLMKTANNIELWYKYQHHMSERVMVSFEISNNSSVPLVCKSTIAIELMCYLIGNSQLGTELYTAEQIGYTWSILPNVNGNNSISGTVTGLTYGIDMVLGKIWEVIFNLPNFLRTLSYINLSKSRISIRKKYQEMITSGGSVEQILAGTQSLLEVGIWSIDERLEILEELELHDLIELGQQLVSSSDTMTTVFIEGDIEESLAPKFIDIFGDRNHANLQQDEDDMIPSYYVENQNFGSYLVPGEQYAFSSDAPKESQTNTVSTYVQIGERDSLFDRTFTKLLSILLQSLAPMELRMKRNLGYNIYTGQRINRTTIGVYIIIISRTYETEYLAQQINEFLYEWCIELEKSLGSKDSTIFEEKILQPLLDNFDKPDLGGVGSSNINFGLLSPIGSDSKPSGDKFIQHKNCWTQIIDRTYRFKSICGEEEIDCELIRNMTSKEFLQVFQEKISPFSTKRASVTINLNSRVVLNEKMKQITEFLNSKGLHEVLTHSEIERVAKSSNYIQEIFKEIKIKGAKYRFIRKAKSESLAMLFMSKAQKIEFPKHRAVSTEQFHSECTRLSR